MLSDEEIFIYLPSYIILMKVKFLIVFAVLILLFINFTAIYLNILWLAHTAYILFFISTMIFFIKKISLNNAYFFLFISCTFLSFIFRLFHGQWFCDEVSLVLLSAGNFALIIEASKYLEIKNASSLMQLFFVFIIGINTLLLCTHVYELQNYISSTIEFYLYSLYYLNLLILRDRSFSLLSKFLFKKVYVFHLSGINLNFC